MMSIGETAKALEISLRALRHYDKIGLVKPSAVSMAGYRSYDAQALARLQAVLFYKELGFSLKDIAAMLAGPEAEVIRALSSHRELLLLKKQRIQELIELVDSTIGGTRMSRPRTTLKDIQDAKRSYALEARERWGEHEAYAASQAHRRSEEEELAVAGRMDDIIAAFADCRALPASDAKVQALVGRWQDFISSHHYPCSPEMLKGLGEMYMADERFTASLDRFGEGTARLMSEAIALYCAKA